MIFKMSHDGEDTHRVICCLFCADGGDDGTWWRLSHMVVMMRTKMAMTMD